MEDAFLAVKAVIRDRDIDRLGAMRPLGLFSVDRGILTSMLSVSVTYLIILIQFRRTFEVLVRAQINYKCSRSC